MPTAVPGPVDSKDDIRLALRSWPEVDAYLSRCKGVILPLGSTEQHGPTGAIGTDALTAEAVALEIGRRTGVLVAPVQAFGMAEHHLGFAGTMSLQPATLPARRCWQPPWHQRRRVVPQRRRRPSRKRRRCWM